MCGPPVCAAHSGDFVTAPLGCERLSPFQGQVEGHARQSRGVSMAGAKHPFTPRGEHVERASGGSTSVSKAKKNASENCQIEKPATVMMTMRRTPIMHQPSFRPSHWRLHVSGSQPPRKTRVTVKTNRSSSAHFYDVRLRSKADIASRPRHVRSSPQNRHSSAHGACLLCAISRHSPRTGSTPFCRW